MRARDSRRKQEREAQARRESAAICGAKKRNGSLCGQQAGWGTDHPGLGRCKFHTGSTRAGVIAASKTELSMAAPANVTPGQALGAVMKLASGQLLFATLKVSQLGEDELFVEGDQKDSGAYEMIPNVWVALQRQVMGDLARYAKLAADAGIAERQTSLAESQTEQMAALIEAVMGDVGLNKKQQAALGPAIRRHLVAVPEEQAA